MSNVRRVFLLLAVATASLYAEGLPTLAIMDLSAKTGVSKADASVLTEFVYGAVFRLGRDAYRVIARDLRDELLKEQEFALSDVCDDKTCALRVGQFLSADYVIVGSFTKFGSQYYVSFQLVNVKTTEVEGNAQYASTDYDGIAQSVDKSVKELLAMVNGGTSNILPYTMLATGIISAGTSVVTLILSGQAYDRHAAATTYSQAKQEYDKTSSLRTTSLLAIAISVISFIIILASCQ